MFRNRCDCYSDFCQPHKPCKHNGECAYAIGAGNCTSGHCLCYHLLRTTTTTLAPPVECIHGSNCNTHEDCGESGACNPK